MKTPFRALLLEDVPKDAELLQEMLLQEGFSCAMDGLRLAMVCPIFSIP